jgi:ketosteroid isomerase-like protein
MSEENRALVQKHLDAEARHDATEAASCYHPDGEYFQASLGLRFSTRAGVQAQYAASYASIPDLEATVEEETQGPSSLVHRGRIRGTVQNFLGLPAGGHVDMPFLAIYDIANGQILRETVHFDLELFCEQSGADIAAVRSAATAIARAMASAAA